MLSLPRSPWSLIDSPSPFAVPFLIVGFGALPRSAFDPLIALVCEILLARVVLAPSGDRPSRLVRVLESRPFAGLGLISDSVFLRNYPVAVFLTRHGSLSRPDDASSIALNLAIGVPTVLALSTATYLLVGATRALRLRRTSRNAVAPMRLPGEAVTLTTP